MGNTIDAISVNGTEYNYAWGGIADPPFGTVTTTPAIAETSIAGSYGYIAQDNILVTREELEQGDELLVTVDGTEHASQIRLDVNSDESLVAGSGAGPFRITYLSSGNVEVYLPDLDGDTHSVSASVRKRSKVGKEYLPFDGGAEVVAYSGTTTLESNGDYYECSITLSYNYMPRRFDYLRVTIGDTVMDMPWLDGEGASSGDYSVVVSDGTASYSDSSVSISSQGAETELDITVAFVLEPKIPTRMIPSVSASTSLDRLSIVDALNLLSDCINAVISGESPEVPTFEFDDGRMPNHRDGS